MTIHKIKLNKAFYFIDTQCTKNPHFELIIYIFIQKSLCKNLNKHHIRENIFVLKVILCLQGTRIKY